VAAQTSPAVSQAVSVSSSFSEDSTQQKCILALLKDVIDLRNAVDTLTTQYNSLVELYNVHVHAADGSEAGAYRTSIPLTDGPTIAGSGTASVGEAGTAPVTMKVTV